MIIYRKVKCPKCDFESIFEFDRKYDVDEWLREPFCHECGMELEVGDEINEQDYLLEVS